MTRIICLANYRKHNHRCIADISPKTGKWIKPISNLPDGAITWEMRQISKQEPSLLDVIEIPLQKTGPDYGCQPENRSLSPGKWRKAGKAKTKDIIAYCETGGILFHNQDDRISLHNLQRLPLSSRNSLLLIRNRLCKFIKTTSSTGRPQIRCQFPFGRNTYNLVVTDPLIERRVRQGEEISRRCILTISLGMPWLEYCYKLVASVMEL